MKDLQKLKTFIIEKARLCVHEAEGKMTFSFTTPSFGITPGADDNAAVPERSSSGRYLQMYDWDACYFAQAAYRAGISGLRRATVANFVSFESADGYIPRTVSPQRVWDGEDLAKPFLAQTLMYQNGNPGEEGVEDYVTALADYLSYFEKTRQGPHGLYHWRNVLESGVDNNLSLLAPQEAARDENQNVGAFPDGQLLACDLNAYLVAEYIAYGQLLRRARMAPEALKYERIARGLSGQIEKYLWNEDLAMYCNLDPRSGKQVQIRSWTGLVPALLSVVPEDKVRLVIERNILSEQHFLRPAGLSSVAASELLYNQSKRGLYGAVIVSNWQGPVWVLPNVLTVRCLLQYGYRSQAHELSRRVVTTMINALNDTGTLFENYDAETGKPLWATDFMSWNILALELIDLLERD